MIALALGLAAAGALLWGAGAFSRARVADVKMLLAWVAGLAGLALAAGLFLTGRGLVAVAALVLLGPLAWTFWQESPGRTRAAPSTRMGRMEAFAVLGLAPGASESEVLAAWGRLRRVVHPDGGGTEWLASRVNQARDVLLTP